MRKNNIPLAYRDRCATLWVPLEKCRRESKFLPWKCSQEKHDYEQCQYMDFERRMEELKQIKARESRIASEKSKAAEN